MRTSTLQGNLNKACKQVSKALSKRGHLPVLTHIKLETHESMFYLTATDLEMAVSVGIGAMNEEDGSICVPGKLFSQLVTKAPKDSRFDLETDGHTLIVKTGNSEMRLSGMDSEDFPPIPDKFTVYATIEPDTLRDAIEQTAYAVADEDNRPVLTAVCLTPKKDALDHEWLEFAAADGFRLAVRKAYAETFSKAQILVRGDNLDKLAGFLKGAKEPIKILANIKMYQPKRYDKVLREDVDDGEPYEEAVQVAFAWDCTTVICQCVKGSFPNYQQLIPMNHDTSITFNREALLSAAQSIKGMLDADARGSSNIMRLELEPQFGELGRLALMAKSEQVGDVRHEIDCHFEDTGIDSPARRIAFNVKYVVEMLASLDCDAMTLEITTPSSPGLFYPQTQSSHDDNYQHIIMPMFVEWAEKPVLFDAWTDLMGATVGDYADSEPWDGLREPCHNCEDSDNIAKGYVELNDGKCTDCGRQVTEHDGDAQLPETLSDDGSMAVPCANCDPNEPCEDCDIKPAAYTDCPKCIHWPDHGGTCHDFDDGSRDPTEDCGKFQRFIPPDQQMAESQAVGLAV